MDINQQDLIKFWTWCGFKENPDKSKLWNYDGKYKETNHWWIAPNYKNYVELPQPTLDTLYTYAIPKLQDKGYSVILLAFEHQGFRVIIHDEIHDVEKVIELGDNPAEVLYRAIMEVIKNEK